MRRLCLRVERLLRRLRLDRRLSLSRGGRLVVRMWKSCDHAHRICAQLHGPGEPLLVRCQRAKWSGRLRLDAALDVGAATLMILVAVDVLLHFGQYKRYPYVCHQLCRSYSAHWRLHSQKFLAVPDGELDLGL